jgi:hypothetical protein
METSQYPKVIRAGKVAVLFSPDFGAGWYTWNTEKPECLFDPDIVALVEAGRNKEIEEFVGDKWDTESHHFYFGGAYNLEIEWLPQGTRFIVNEYDGSESIQTIQETDWILA